MIENLLFLFDKIRHYPICTLSCKLRKHLKVMSSEKAQGPLRVENDQQNEWSTLWFLQVQMEM